jgi:hypothetical protein
MSDELARERNRRSRQRSQTPDAIRARRNRAEHKNGLRTYVLKLDVRRVMAALRAANREGETEAELLGVLNDFCDRWLGPPK